MLVRFKFRAYIGGVMYEQGEQEVPDDSILPSTAARIDELSPKKAKKVEVDTLSGLLPKTAMEQDK